MKRNKLFPFLSGILLLSSCTSSFDSEKDALAACKKWMAEEGEYTLNLILPRRVGSIKKYNLFLR